jgi:hypothetical protein
MATAIVVWCIASFLIAPLVGRAICTRPGASVPEPAPERKAVRKAVRKTARKHEMQPVFRHTV